MGKRDPRIDAYIDAAAGFAQPILRHLRDVVHATCPDVEETMKWSFPHFDYNGIFCSMAAFKGHCTFGFWDGGAVVGDAAKEGAMGQFGRITSLKDLPSRRVLAGYIEKGMALKESGGKPHRATRRQARPEPEVPKDLAAALKKNRRAAATFRRFSPSHRREYVEWVTEAKREETRAKRIAQAVEWMEVGKGRNWKYE